MSFRPLQINKALKPSIRQLADETVLDHYKLTRLSNDVIWHTDDIQVLDHYKLTRLSNLSELTKAGYTVLDHYKLTRLSNKLVGVFAPCHVLDHYKLTRLSNLKSGYFSGLRFSPSLTPWQGAVNYASIIQQSLSYIKHFSFFSFPEKLPSINNKNTFS